MGICNMYTAGEEKISFSDQYRKEVGPSLEGARNWLKDTLTAGEYEEVDECLNAMYFNGLQVVEAVEQQAGIPLVAEVKKLAAVTRSLYLTCERLIPTDIEAFAEVAQGLLEVKKCLTGLGSDVVGTDRMRGEWKAHPGD